MNRLVVIMAKELENDKLKAEERLEKLVNNQEMDINFKLAEIKCVLREIDGINAMAELWAAYTTPPAQEGPVEGTSEQVQ